MSNTIVPFRPRDQVPRLIRSFRSEPPEHPLTSSGPMRIEGDVPLGRFMHALRFVGFVFRFDKRTGEFVVMPDPGVKS
jgi:hypothetical protein